MFFMLTSNHRNTAHGNFFKFRYHCRSCCYMLWEKMQTVILIIMYTEGLNQVMNHHPKILIFPVNHEGTISTLLLLVKHHHSLKEVVPQTYCWDILLKTKMRCNSWWPKIKLVCKLTWKRTPKWPYFSSQSKY